MNHRLTPIAPRLGKLLPMLPSLHDGEVVAAARAIQSTLHDAGYDWHDLVQALFPPPVSASADSDWRDDVARCAENMDYFDNRDRDFLRSMAHWRGQPSQKQRDRLAALADRVRGGA